MRGIAISSPVAGLSHKWTYLCRTTRVEPRAEETTPGIRFADHPPFDLEPDEYPAPGESVDIPMILANRQEKAFRKDEARRDDRRREIEKLRA